MVKRKQRTVSRGGASAETFPMAFPLRATELIRRVAEKLLTVLVPFTPKNESPGVAAAIHEQIALALFTVAAFHISHMPSDVRRQTILDRMVPLLKVLVRDNEAAREGKGTAATMSPDATKH